MSDKEYGGHDWRRKYNTGRPMLAMVCAACGKVWHPDMTVKQLGRCPQAHPTEASA